jgi:hypothetical protein
MKPLKVVIIVGVLIYLPASEAKSKSEKTVNASKAVCYEERIKTDTSDVQRVVVDLDTFDARFEFGGGSKVPYFLQAMCKREKGRIIKCNVECDGGHATMELVGGKLNFDSDGINLDASIETALHMVDDSDSFRLAGSFTLNPVPEQVCTAAFAAEGRNVTSLQRGDFSPRVLRVEKYLADLGYLVQRPDWYFDRASEEAVSAFQRSAGLPVSGIADGRTIAKLRLVTQLRGGC